MSFATGKRSKAISDRSGMEYPYKEMVKEWNGSLVHISEFEPKHPQLDPPHHKADAIALKNPRVIKFQQPTQEFANDQTISDSGGIHVGVANLSLPGDFALEHKNLMLHQMELRLLYIAWFQKILLCKTEEEYFYLA